MSLRFPLPAFLLHPKVVGFEVGISVQDGVPSIVEVPGLSEDTTKSTRSCRLPKLMTAVKYARDEEQSTIPLATSLNSSMSISCINIRHVSSYLKSIDISSSVMNVFATAGMLIQGWNLQVVIAGENVSICLPIRRGDV